MRRPQKSREEAEAQREKNRVKLKGQSTQDLPDLGVDGGSGDITDPRHAVPLLELRTLSRSVALACPVLF